MKLSLIAALDESRVIGMKGKLPWRLANDLKWFKQKTLGKMVLMGRRTFDSLPKKPLEGRKNVVLSRSEGGIVHPQLIWIRNLSQLRPLLEEYASEELMVIGGAEIYALFLPYAHRLYLTEVATTMEEGDAFFPEWRPSEWDCIERQQFTQDLKNAFDFSCAVYERKACPLDFYWNHRSISSGTTGTSERDA